DAPVDAAALGLDLTPAAPTDAAAIGLDVSPAEPAPAEADAEADAALPSARLADQWADAAERPIPRQETDTRNTLGWVPPSREIVVTVEPQGPPPEPVVAYAPAAPPAPTAAAAPWAV